MRSQFVDTWQLRYGHNAGSWRSGGDNVGLGGGRSAWGIDTGAYYIVLQCGWGLDADIRGGVAGSWRSAGGCAVYGRALWRSCEQLEIFSGGNRDLQYICTSYGLVWGKQGN